MPNATPTVPPLPARLDVDAACALWQRIAGAEDDLILDASAVTHLGAAGLQVLLVARRILRARGRQLVLEQAGPDLIASLARMGAPDLIPSDGTGPKGGTA